ncbi:MAG: hypothetical protein L0Z48_10305 [candidate division Zixibacteria bacterium]|nr:hypothetical protein [candidate division Zixibacteria bacterium]
MKKVKLAMAVALIYSSTVWADSLKITTTTSATADKVGDVNRPGLLFKFDLPAELEKARIDLAYLRFKVEADTSQQAIGLLVRPMLAPWVSGLNYPLFFDSLASPFHANFGRLNVKDGTGKIEITQAVKAWQTGELANLGLLVYPDEEEQGSLQVKNWPSGGVAELEIFYTAPEKK